MKLVITALIVCAGLVSPVRAALPDAVDGEPLPSLAPMLEATTPTVVNIATRGTVTVQNPLMQDPFFRRFFNLPAQRERRTQSLGSGVIVNAERGYIVTNHHVVEHARQIRVTLHDGRELAARRVGSDAASDLAVIQIDADKLVAARWFDSDALRVGDFVVAIGNPFGLGQTVTSGIVSALGRSGLGTEELEDFIQTDASINPGNSGGALVNLRGELVGINTAIIDPSGGRGGNVGIGFAIPANQARRVMQDLVSYGVVQRGGMGVTLQDLRPDLADALDVPVRQGAVLARVRSGSPAEAAGLRPGDVVIEAGGRRVRGADELINQIGLRTIGTDLMLTVQRGQRRFQVSVRIQ
ncbi:MAG: trypsin-like peptidase domain-containing protein [Pseudomonadota bacterium]